MYIYNIEKINNYFLMSLNLIKILNIVKSNKYYFS